MSEREDIQEDRYAFPYHYLPRFEKGRFSQVRTLRWGYEYFSYVSFVLDKLESRGFETLLDVGCGDAAFLHHVRGRFGEKRLVGIDVSAQAILHARPFNPQIEFVIGEITEPEVINEEFDVVTCIDVLEHISPEKLPAFVGGLHRCVNPGGTLIVTVPSRNIEVSRKHYQHFDAESLSEALTPQFSVSETFYLNRKSWWVRRWHRVLTNSLFILNEKHLVDWIYRHYQRRFLPASPSNAARICAICAKNS